MRRSPPVCQRIFIGKTPNRTFALPPEALHPSPIDGAGGRLDTGIPRKGDDAGTDNTASKSDHARRAAQSKGGDDGHQSRSSNHSR